MKEMIPRRFVSDLKVLLQSGKTMDESLGHLRGKGASPIECIIAIKEHSGCSLTEAKQIIHSSRTWHDVAKATEKMWDNLIEEIEKE